MRIQFQRFQVKDVAFLAILAALLVLCAAVAMPLMTISLFGLRNMATCIFYGIFGTIALMKVRKPGALSLMGIFNAAVLLMMSPVMFFNNSVSAILAELIALLIFKSYDNEKAIVAAAGLMIPISLPVSIFFGMVINGQTVSDIVQSSWVVVLTCAGTVVLSFLGTLIGRKVGGELQKAGKLK